MDPVNGIHTLSKVAIAGIASEVTASVTLILRSMLSRSFPVYILSQENVLVEPLNLETQHRELLEDTQEFLRMHIAQRVPDADFVAAWDEFYRVYDVLIRRFVAARGLRGADIEDCVQDVWINIARRLASFQITSEAGLRSWLYTLVRSRATDMFRRRSRDVTLAVGDIGQAGLEPVGREADPAASEHEEWETALVQTMLLKLQSDVSELNFEIFRLRSLEGVSIEDTAKCVGISEERVRYRHHRTMKKLKAIAAFYTGRELRDPDA